MPIRSRVIGNPGQKEDLSDGFPRIYPTMEGMLTLLGLVRIEVAIRNQFANLACLNCHNTDNWLEWNDIVSSGLVTSTPRLIWPTYLHAKEEEIEIEIPAGKDIFVHDSHQNRWTAISQYRQDGIIGKLRNWRTSGPNSRGRRLEILIAVI